MAISLDGYLNWAKNQTNSDTKVALSTRLGEDAKLKDVNKVCSNSFVRFFMGGYYKNAALKGFKSALTRQYGKSVADYVMGSRYIHYDLTAETILRYARSAKDRHQQLMLGSYGSGYALKTNTKDVIISEAMYRNLPKATKQTIQDYIKYHNDAKRLTGWLMTDENQLAQYARLIENIDNLKAHIGNDSTLAQQTKYSLVASLDADIVALTTYKNTVKESYVSKKKEDDHLLYFNHVWKIVLVVLRSELEKEVFAKHNTNRPDENLPEKKISKAIMPVIEAVSENVNFSGRDSFSKRAQILAERIETELSKTNDAAALDAVGGQKGLAEKLKAMFIDALNVSVLKPIEKNIHSTLGNTKYDFTSKITFGRHIGVGIEYEDRSVDAFMCRSTTERHAVNLAISELTMKGDGQDSNPKTVFAGVRHAVHSAYGINDETERNKANKERAIETIKAAALLYLNQHPEKKNSKEPIDLPMTSVSLLTSTFLTGEDKMVVDQWVAWESVEWDCGQDVYIDVVIAGTEYKVKPKIAKFNFGVNSLALKYGFGWGVVDEVNRDSFKKLENMANSFVSSCPDDKTRNAVKTLLRQTKKILDEKLEHSEGHEAYKAASRIAVLTYLMGGVPCWNCQSGKDRTGAMDLECKFLAALIEAGEDIPEPNAPLTSEQENLYRKLALEGGNLEMQEYNTGLPGYKLSVFESIKERMGGDDEALTYLKGYSNVVEF